MKIGNFEIGGTSPCFIIAEVGQAHDGSLGMAHAYIDAAADAGADAVKFQTHIAHAESTPAEPWRTRFSYQDQNRYDYWKRMEFEPKEWEGLKRHCDERKVIFLSSPFSNEAIDLLLSIGVPAWKVPSGEVNNSRMITRLAGTGLPVLLSSGMSYLEELADAISTCRAAGTDVGLFQCTTMYPCPPSQIGLNILAEYTAEFDCPVGLSDHSGEIFPGLAAVAIGCQMLEIHIAFHKKMFGPDVSSSLDIGQLRDLTNGVRYIEQIRNNPVDKNAVSSRLLPTRALFTKSMVATREIQPGEVLSTEDITFKKPGTGISDRELHKYLGRKLTRKVSEGSLLKAEDFLNQP